MKNKNKIDKSIAEVFTSPDSLQKRFTQIAAGATFSIALRNDSTVWSWGDNTYGQLGCGNIKESKSPVQVLLPPGIIAIAAGPDHALALRKDGTVWSWGENSFGQLGDSTNVSNRIPAQIKSLSGIIAIAAGGESYQVKHTYFSRVAGFSIALKNDGTVWNWGSNSRCNNAVQSEFWVPGQMNSLTDIIAIAAGGFHSLALKKDGTVWAWGDNALAQLGNDSHQSDFCAANQIMNLKEITAIAASGDHSMALASDSTVWTWGDNPQVYNATKKFTYVPEKIENLKGVISISAGSSRFLALTKNGWIWTWETKYNIKISKVAGIESVTAISGGASHSLALKKNGTIWAWGNNDKGQLGDGTKKDREYPVQSGIASAEIVKPAKKEKQWSGPVYH